MNEMLLERITVDPRVMDGKPVIRGTRLPVGLLVRMVGQGISEKKLLHEYPGLTALDIRAALTYAADAPAQA